MAPTRPHRLDRAGDQTRCPTNPSNAVVGNMRYPNISGFTVRPIALEDAPAWAAYICLAEVKRHTSMTAETVDDVRRQLQNVNVLTACARRLGLGPRARRDKQSGDDEWKHCSECIDHGSALQIA